MAHLQNTSKRLNALCFGNTSSEEDIDPKGTKKTRSMRTGGVL